MEITKEQIESWLGSSKPFEEAIEVLTDLANGQYSLENFKKDIEDYNQE